MRGRLRSLPAVIARWQALPLWLPLLVTMATLSVPAQEASPPLTTAAAVRGLAPEEAARGRPVQLRGTLLLVGRWRDALVLRDETDGIYVELEKGIGPNHRPGERLEVIGVSGAGDFAPVVRARRLTWMGEGPLPPPRPTTIAEVDAGGLDAAWVELEGIIRSCQRGPGDARGTARGAGAGGAPGAEPSFVATESWTISIAQGADRMTVQLHDRVVPEQLIDAKVRLRGVVFNVHNANRQFVRADVQVANQGMVTMLTPPPADPFSRPLQPISDILRFTPTGFSGHRIRLRGVVTAHHQGRALWLQEGGQGLRVASAQAGLLLPTDVVEVVGFADHGGYAPSLSDAIFRQVASGPPANPVTLRSADEVSRRSSSLVQIEARLEDMRNTADGMLLSLRWGDTSVGALLPRGAGQGEAPAWEPGSWARVTGICVPLHSDSSPTSGLWVTDNMQMLLRSPADVVVIRRPPWLTTQRALLIAVVVAVVVVCTLIVVAVLARRQIAQREEARKLAEVEFAAMLAERNRLARELHDTIAQELNAVSMQMELAKNSAKGGSVEEVMPHLVTAHGIVRGCLAETRESIWDMRSHILEKTDLLGALRSVAERMSAGQGCAVRTQTRGKSRRLAPLVENHLLRIGQEAVSNALKHARARVIELELSFEPTQVRLEIRDDGQGFDPARERAGGHFGLRGMRERVAQMNGELTIRPGDKGGTCVEVVVRSRDG